MITGGDPAGPFEQNAQLSIGMRRTDMGQITTPARSLRTTCTATAPEAVRTFRTYPPTEPTRLVPQTAHHGTGNRRSRRYELKIPQDMSKLSRSATLLPIRSLGQCLVGVPPRRSADACQGERDVLKSV